MKVYQTGIRDGEFITSAAGAKQNRGSLLQVRGNYPPSQKSLPQDEYGWSILLQQLEIIPFFAQLSLEARKTWLLDNASSNDDLYLQDVPLQVKVIKLEGQFFRDKLSSELIDQLIAGNPEDAEGYWNLSYIYNLIPRKPGSRARRHTLIFRPGNWQVYNSPLEDPAKLKHYSGPVINLNQQTLTQVQDTPVDYLVPLNYASAHKRPLNDSLLGIITNSSNTLAKIPSEYVSIQDLLNWASPSVHKSLIQKILRTGSAEVTHTDKTYQADHVLITSFLMLLKHSGSFVPDIQRYVSGQESALKRLAVSICEDTYTDNYAAVMSLYAAALLTQTHNNWHPTSSQIDAWCQLAIQARQSKYYFKYSLHTLAQHTQLNLYTMSCLLLNEIRSFQSDINMVSNIDGSYEKGTILLESMPLIHCIDHHNITDLAYHFPKGTCLNYKELFKLVWNCSSGINPRKNGQLNNTNTLRCIRYAQNMIWQAKTITPEVRSLLDQSTTVTYELSDQWLAGMLGPISVRINNTEIWVTLHPDDIYSMVPLKRPDRRDKEVPQLSAANQQQAIQMATAILQQGCALKATPEAMSWFKQSILYLYQDEYVIQLADGSLHLWRELRNTKCTFQHHAALAPTLENSIFYVGEGFDEDAANQLQHLLNTASAAILRRLLMFLSSARSTISLFKISRDGSGQEYAVSALDTEVFHIMAALCVLYPGALCKINTRQFKVRYGPYIWNLQEKIKQQLSAQQQQLYGTSEWGQIQDYAERTLWPHQCTAWQKMSQETRGHLLWIPVGMGKTLIIMRYLQYLIEENKMPKYVVYTLPPSAIENTLKEVQAFGFGCHLMDLRANATAQAHSLYAYTINLVKHDHLRLGGDLFREVAAEALIIVDEFHLTLNKTLRTSMALELTQTAHDFIGLSGTVVQSENVEDLIQWLQQIVDFEVTSNNFWVAVSAMISNRVETGVKVVHHSHEIQLPDTVKTKYLALVGASLGGHNPKPTPADFRQAVALCHQVCMKELVEVCLQYYHSGQNVFMVAKDIAQQTEIQNILINARVPATEIVLLSKDQSVAITPTSTSPVRIAITTIKHSTGYTFTKAQIMLTSVYFSNQATREQLEGRINRIGQTSEQVYVITVHTSVLTYVMQKYENARSLSSALKQLANEII